MVNFPASLDALSNPTGATTQDAVGFLHSTQHGNANDAIEAIEAKLGIGASTAAANTVLRGTGAGATAFGQIVAGDIAAGATMQKLDEQIISVAGGFVTLTIPSGYRHLLIRALIRGVTAATTTPLIVRFNGDVGGNYDYQWIAGAAAVASAAEGLAQTGIIPGFVTAGSAPAGVASEATLRIAHHAGTTFQKTMTAEVATKGGTASGNLTAYQAIGFWRNPAAITSVTLSLNVGNIDVGSVFTAYGEPV